MGSDCCKSKVDAPESEIRTGFIENLPKQQLQDIEHIVPQISQTYLAQTSHKDDNHEPYKDSYQASFQESPLSNNIIIRILETNHFIQQQVFRHFENKECVLNQNVVISSDRDLIILSGPIVEVTEANQIVLSILELYHLRYIRKCLDLNDKQVAYFNQNLWIEKSEIEKNQNCKITIHQINEPQQDQSEIKVLQQISYQDKDFKIIQVDIHFLKSKAIVNSSNQQLKLTIPRKQTGISQQIQQLGGIQYQNSCQDYIKNNYLLKSGTVLIQDLNEGFIRYILTIATPFYELGYMNSQDLQIIRQNIYAIFETPDKLKIQEITFPIIGGSTFTLQFNLSVQAIISSVLEGLYSMNTSVKIANIIEIDKEQISVILQVCDELINGSPKRQIKYQWQWMDGVFKDYDDEDINEQIDRAFEEYVNDNSKNEIRLKFPFCKLPGTHKVDLSNNTLTDKNLNKVTSIKQDQQNNTYMFGNLPIDDNLNELLFTQRQKGILQFEIFYKRHKIVFSNQQILQINEDTNYERSVQYIPYEKPQSPVNEFVLKGKQFQLLNKSCVVVEVIDIENFNRIQQDIQKIIQSNFVEMIFTLPYIEGADLDLLIQMIKTNSLEIHGQMVPGQNITILVNRDIQQQINDHISQSQQRKQVNHLSRFHSF